MSKSIILIFLVASTCVLLCSCGDKFNKDDNRVDNGPERIEPKFRHKQVNKVWEKALRKNLNQNKLEDFRKQLKKIDEKYLQNKKDMQSSDVPTEQYKQQEKIIDGHLQDAMVRFGIMPSKDGFFSDKGQVFRDRRVNDLWSSALNNGQFSDDELEILKKDLLAHQVKVEEFQAAIKDHKQPMPNENEVGAGDKDKVHPMERRAADIDMKLKHRDLTQDFQRLAVKVIPDEERGGFNDHKVVQLWQEAMKADFDPEELEKLRQELKEFEKEIENNDELHKKVLHAEKDHLTSKNKSNLKDPEAMKEKRGILASAREELQTVSKKVTNLMRNFKDKLGKAGKKNEL